MSFTICAVAGTVAGSVEIDAAKGRHALSDVIVWLKPLQPDPTIPVSAQRARLLQKDKMFHPHVLAIPVGSTVDFPNADPIFHNAFSNYDGQLFDVGLYPPGTSRAVRFRRPGVVRVFCNIHPSMSAVILVLDTPFFTTASAEGHYRISNVPSGAYELHVFDERATGGEVPEEDITVTDEPETIAPKIHVSETGYVSLPHKNKYGQDYPPNADTYGAEGPPK